MFVKTLRAVREASRGAVDEPLEIAAFLASVQILCVTLRAPTAIESLFLHPMETFLGQFLLTAVACVMGPLDPLTWGVILLVHSNLNIIVHAGLDIQVPGLRLFSALARKHAKHHVSMRGGNFASLTPLWDMLFGTAE